MTKHRIETLLDNKGGKYTDRCGLFQDFGTPVKKEGSSVTEYPATLKVRTGGIVNHPYFGRIVNDFAGMLWHKDRLVLDWIHNPNEEIGIIDSYSAKTGDLICESRLLSRNQNDRAAKIKDYSDCGMPYEVSMTWGRTQDGRLVIEDVEEGGEAIVNGKTVYGPVSIIRVWGMYGAAVCPHGVDSTTSTTFHDFESDTMPKILKDFIEKFGNEKGLEYMLNDSITTIEQAEKIHADYLAADKDAKITELSGIVDALTVDNKKFKEDLEKAQKDFDEFKAKVETGKADAAKTIEDATKIAEENDRLKKALPGVNVQDTPTPPTESAPRRADVDPAERSRQTKKAYEDSLVEFFEKAVK